MVEAVTPDSVQTLGPEAFKKLYPEQYYRKFIENGIRPDGRVFGRARPASIGLDAVSKADASALVKIGSTTVLAGIKLQVLFNSEGVDKGELTVNVEATPLCYGNILDRRRANDVAQNCTEQVGLLLHQSGAVDLSKLAISSERAWLIRLDIHILDSDGSLLDACMLGAVAALTGLKALPKISVDETGAIESQGTSSDGSRTPINLVDFDRVPVSLTCGFYGEAFSADLTAEEEQLSDCIVTVTTDASSRLIGLYKPGGKSETSTSQLYDCITHAKLRHQEVLELLKQSLRDQTL